MDFYFGLLKMFYKAKKNLIGIHINAKCILEAKVQYLQYEFLISLILVFNNQLKIH